MWKDHLDYTSSVYVKSYVDSCNRPIGTGLRAGEEVTPGFPEERFDNNLIPVYEVEWVETDKDFVM